MIPQWERHRRIGSYTLDLIGLFHDWLDQTQNKNAIELDSYQKAISFLHSVESLMPIKSRQAAAVALATAQRYFIEGL